MRKILKNKKAVIFLCLFITIILVLTINFANKKGKQKSTTSTVSKSNSTLYQSIFNNSSGSTTITSQVEKVPEKVTEIIHEEAEKLPNTNDYIIEETKDFTIAYFEKDQGFIIAILGSPFEEKKALAEKAFLKALEIEKGEACNLKVEITTTIHANPEEAKESHYFSFCE